MGNHFILYNTIRLSFISVAGRSMNYSRFKHIRSLTCIAALFFCANMLQAQNIYHAVAYDSRSLLVDGKEIFVYSASFHYFRCPKELWRDRFRKIKAAGFNTVETYIPWNWHERNMPKDIRDDSQFDFSELKEWLHMAQHEFGLYTIVRPGPFICAEWAGGGYPRWLARFRPKVDGFWLRSNDPEDVKWSLHWFNAVGKFIAGEQITHKPRGEKGIILVQIENEYDSYELDEQDKTSYLRSLYGAVRKAGVTVPVFTCLTSQCRGSRDSVLAQVFDCDNYYVGLNDAVTCAQRMSDLKQKQPNAPGFVTELQGGWFSTVDGKLAEDHPSDYRHSYALGMMSLLGGATGLNYYMFYGGTHFAGWGARGQTTTYDYNAAIRENGSLSEKYLAAKNLGAFIQKYQRQLVNSKGGVCTFEHAPAELVGGIRVAGDGTKLVFLHNSSVKKKIAGSALIRPGVDATSSAPIYNINQNGEKVQVKIDPVYKNRYSAVPSFEINYELDSLETKVLIIPPHTSPDKGTWWHLPPEIKKKPDLTSTPQVVRIKNILKYNEDFKANWKTLPPLVSLPELGVNDCRYVLYRSQFSLSESGRSQFSKLLFNTFSRDILNVQVNGKIATRTYPSEKWTALVWRDVDKSFKQIGDKDYDNRFDISGLLQPGDNEIVVLYENIGHEHGYYPMEELCGIKRAGLSSSDSTLQKPLSWKVATNLAGIENNLTQSASTSVNWQETSLDTSVVIPRKGNNIQPKGKQDALFTWYQAAFEMPSKASAATWRLLINASGNGYVYLNGHNIGRHWEAGPQREFYLPECWLRFGKNEKNVITLGLRQTMNGAVIKAMEIAPY